MNISAERQIESRYSRHREFSSPTEQGEVFRAKVLLAGCGAGSTLAPNLSRFGYATQPSGLIILADPDKVDISNLNRQAFSENSIGKNKAEALKEEMVRLNSATQIQVIAEGITRQNVAELVSQSEIVVDMVDVAKPATMLALHREAQRQRKPVVTGFDLGEGTTTLVYDYRDPDAMTLDRLLGLEKVSIEDLESFSHIATTAIASQCLIGPTRATFADIEEAQDYYNNFFNIKSNVDKLKAVIPQEMHSVIDKLLTGELEYIPQINTASVTLGNVHEKVLRNLLSGRDVITAPDAIRTNMRVLIEPEVTDRLGVSRRGLEVIDKDPYLVTSGLASTHQDTLARQVLVMLAYLKNGYINEKDPGIDTDNGIYRDIWETVATPLVAKIGPYVVGSIRVIRKTPIMHLPIQLPDTDGFTVEIYDEYRRLVENVPFEVSQLAKSPSPEYRSERNITPALLRAFVKYMQDIGADYAVATLDEKVRKLLNGPHFRLGLKTIGPTTHYMGSDSTPVFVDIHDMIESSKKARREGLSDFLRVGKGVPGYEWYQGI